MSCQILAYLPVDAYLPFPREPPQWTGRTNRSRRLLSMTAALDCRAACRALLRPAVRPFKRKRHHDDDGTHTGTVDLCTGLQLRDRPAPLKGGMKGFWSVTVNANWRVTFRFADGEADDVELIDYH